MSSTVSTGFPSLAVGSYWLYQGAKNIAQKATKTGIIQVIGGIASTAMGVMSFRAHDPLLAMAGIGSTAAGAHQMGQGNVMEGAALVTAGMLANEVTEFGGDSRRVGLQQMSLLAGMFSLGYQCYESFRQRHYVKGAAQLVTGAAFGLSMAACDPRIVLAGNVAVLGAATAWSGAKDVAKGHYGRGALKLVGGIGAVASAGYYVYDALQSKSELPPVPSPKKIIFGSTYINGDNQARQEISTITDATHREYTERWNLQYETVTDDRMKGKCQYRDERCDCAPYWNKIEVMRDWLREPRSTQVEEWRIIADDDMPVTNMNIDPYEAIDSLRARHLQEGRNPSCIVARDVANWHEYNPATSVNTGLLIVRKDAASLDLFDRIWEERNRPVNLNNPICPTLGSCQNQNVLHEQEAMAIVLKGDPSLQGRVVAIVPPRDSTSSSRAHIALNTFYRHGCFIRDQSHWNNAPFSYEGLDSANPSGAWREGDWMGQTAGVPLNGWHCENKWGKSVPIRKTYIQQMVERVVRISPTVRMPRPEPVLQSMEPIPLYQPGEPVPSKTILFGSIRTPKNELETRISDLTDATHREYTHRWNINYETVADNQIDEQCWHLNKPYTCDPSWNHIAVMRRWLKEPAAGSAEEWRILVDEDMPVTNMNIDPYDAIDALRKKQFQLGHNPSVIITQRERERLDGTASLFIVRKDRASNDFFDWIWSRKDSPLPCHVSGDWPNDCRPEQRTMALILAGAPSLQDRVVAVVPARDSDPQSGRSHIALNTFHRHGCFVPNGVYANQFSFESPDEKNPSRAWQIGDWMGQPESVPIEGWHCGEERTLLPLREEYIQLMVEHIVRTPSPGDDL